MLLTNATLATLTDKDGFGVIENGAIALDGGKIVWVGRDGSCPAQYCEQAVLDVQGRLITPALVDCHTHVVFGGDRAAEFELRLNGASYEEVSMAGGGIVSTVSATRAASQEQLLAQALRRVDALISEGVCVLEIKSGYGLDQETELKMLRVARAIAKARPIEVRTSYLGAHAVPPEYKGRADAYIDEVCLPVLRAAHGEGLVDAVDGFCESIAFDADQIARVFDLARELGLPVKLHAEQLTHSGGTELAARYGAISVDHLEYAAAQDASAMAHSGSVAVLLPGAFYTLRETQLPPIEAFRDHGVAMAVATDCNPGSSPLTSPLLAMNMACTLFRLTPLEVLKGMTCHASAALGLSGRGHLAAGEVADLCVWDVKHPAELAYRIGFNPLHMRIYRGQV